jgi:hypothetical protein
VAPVYPVPVQSQTLTPTHLPPLAQAGLHAAGLTHLASGGPEAGSVLKPAGQAWQL